MKEMMKKLFILFFCLAFPALAAQSVPATRFLDSMGVNTHMKDQDTDIYTVLSEMQYLGIHHIRDDPRTLTSWGPLVAAGIKFDVQTNWTRVSDNISNLKQVAAMGALAAAEGPNEINNFSFPPYDDCPGFVYRTGWTNDWCAQAFMKHQYEVMKADPTLAAVPVYHYTGSNPENGKSITGMSDFANIHPYSNGTAQPRARMLSELSYTYNVSGPSQSVITEIGYPTGVCAVDRRLPILTLNTFLAAFQLGFQRTYMYVLTDNQWETFGLFDKAHKPKATATAIHNMTTVLADAGQPAMLDDLPFTLKGFNGGPAAYSGYSILLKKSNGRYYLILWREPVLTTDPAPAEWYHVDVGRWFSKVNLYVPTKSELVQYSWTSRYVDLSLSDAPVILELVP